MTTPDDFAPPEDAFSWDLEVTEEHIDELRHVNNVRWVRWVIDIAVAHSHSVGLDVAAYLALGVIWVVRRHEVDYLAPARQGEQIRGLTWVCTYGKRSSVRRTVFVRVSDGKRLLRAATTWVMVDLQGRPALVPESVRDRFPPHRHGETKERGGAFRVTR